MGGWVQPYVDANNPEPPGADHIIRIDKAILSAAPANLAQIDFAFFEVPTRNTVLHRIIQGPDGNMWFTELKTDKVAKLFTSR
jgi:virginiamycin B lyase